MNLEPIKYFDSIGQEVKIGDTIAYKVHASDFLKAKIIRFTKTGRIHIKNRFDPSLYHWAKPIITVNNFIKIFEQE